MPSRSRAELPLTITILPLKFGIKFLMEHLSLEIFDLEGKGSKYAMLPEDATISITDTSEIFASGNVWSYSFSLNIRANAHIFGTAGEMHGSRLHEQINKRRARLWVEGLPLYLGYLILDDEVDVDEDGNVDVRFESGQKTFDDLIENTNAREVSVGDVVIGVALNRKRVIHTTGPQYGFTLDGLEAYAIKDERLEYTTLNTFLYAEEQGVEIKTPYAQRWPKLVKSHGMVYEGPVRKTIDYTNVQTPYDAGHPFCNINICYPFKALNDDNEEVAGRGYTIRFAHNKPTEDGGDNQTRFNNAPNFYLLYFIDRLFKDMKIHIEENQALAVEDLRRVFLLNYGCYYEEIENDQDFFNSDEHTTPSDKFERYGQFYMKIAANGGEGEYLLKNWTDGGKPISKDETIGKVLLRDVNIEIKGENVLSIGSIEGRVLKARNRYQDRESNGFESYIDTNTDEARVGYYSSYLAYATGDNYPNVEISEIISAMKSMFGIRLLFNNDYSTVRIVLLRNIFRSKDVQEISCDIIGSDIKQENSIRGFRMTYGKGTDDTSFYYKGFNDLFPRAAATWKDTTDEHDYSQWKLDADYNEIKQSVSAMNRICYVVPLTGNAYIIKVDEDEDVLFPTLFEAAGFMDAEDGDCTGEAETIEEVQAGAAPVIMNEIGSTYASLFGGDLKAPSPADYEKAQKIATFARMTRQSANVTLNVYNFKYVMAWDVPDEVIGHITGKLDVYMSEGFQIRMLDNYSISNGGTPFDEYDAGLRFGVMRSSGEDAFVRYYEDPDDKEENDTWDIEPGSGAVSHPDTCDNYGKEWDYNGSGSVNNASDAISLMQQQWPDSNYNLIYSSGTTLRNGSTYISGIGNYTVEDNSNKTVHLLFAAVLGGETRTYSGSLSTYAKEFKGKTRAEMYAYDAAHKGILIEAGGTADRLRTLQELQKIAFLPGYSSTMTIDDNGVGSRYGRFSLKLRAKKLNPYFNPKQEESVTNKRYLDIDDPNLCGRGLCDQFYKEYSYWIRNARIANRTVRMTLAQLLAIDKTKRVAVGDIMGFIRKMQFDISNETGLGLVKMEILYI